MQHRPDRRGDEASADSIRASLRRQFDAVYGPEADGSAVGAEGGGLGASKFDEYWRCMRRHVLAEPAESDHRDALDGLLRTKRMKRLHNRFILGKSVLFAVHLSPPRVVLH